VLTKGEVQVLLVARIQAVLESCNSHHINHVEGQIKALLAVLNNGEIPDYDVEDVRSILDAAGIPHVKTRTGWEVPEAWMEKHGATINEDGIVDHPKLGEW
jgi:hypothetical protein